MNDRARLSAILWLSCTLFIIYGTTIPFHFTSDRQFIAEKLSRVTLNPFISPDTGARVSIPDVVQNVLLFVPFGFFGYLTVGVRERSPITRLLIPTALAALLAVGVETLQLFTTDRTTSAADLLADTTGAMGGALAARMAIVFRRQRMPGWAFPRFAELPAFYPLLIASIVLCVAAWEPFDVTLDVGNLLGKLHSLRIDSSGGVSLNEEGLEFLRYALFGLTASLWLQQAGIRPVGALAAIAGIAAAVALEASQLLIQSRMPSVESAIIHTSGAAVGASLHQGWPYGRSAAFWCALLVIATWTAAAMQISSFSVGTIRHTLKLMLLYFPLGFSFQLALRKPWHAWVASVAVAFVGGLALGPTHGSVVGGELSAVDVAIGAMGSLSGAWAGGPGRRAFYRNFVTKLPLTSTGAKRSSDANAPLRC